MDFIFLPEGITASIIPILTLIEHKPELIVGCVLLGHNENEESPLDWFTDSAAELLDYVNENYVLTELNIFLIVKEPNSLLQLTVLAAVGCCNLNFSGEGGRGGEKVLKLLAKHNIRTCPVEVPHPTKANRREEMQVAFQEVFNNVAKYWLPESWGLKAVHY